MQTSLFDLENRYASLSEAGGSMPSWRPRIGEAVMGTASRFLAYYAPCDVLVV